MTTAAKAIRCAIYTRVSTDLGLDQEFNSLDAQYDAASAYIRSQAHAHWTLVRARYDDGGFSGGSTDRPARSWPTAAPRSMRIRALSSSSLAIFGMTVDHPTGAAGDRETQSHRCDARAE